MEQANEIQRVISNWALLVPGLPLAAGLLRIRRLSPAQKRFFWLLLAFAGLSGLNYILSRPGLNLLPLYHLYTLVEFVGYLLVFAALPDRVLSGKAAWVLAGVLALAFLGNALAGGSLYEMPAVIRTAESLLLAGIVLYYFYRVFSEMKVLRLEREFLFWLSLGLLIMFLGNLLLEIFGKEIMHRLDVYYDVWTIKNIRELIAYPLITTGMLCKNPPVK